MKYIKTFEKRFEYLNKEDSDIVEVIMRKFIDELNILDKISKLKFIDYEEKYFDYFELFDNFLTGNIYDEKNIYYVVDRISHVRTPALRNTMGQLIIKIYKEYSQKNKLKEKFDKKLIQLLEKKPEEYITRHEEYSLDWTAFVKKSCQWMLNSIRTGKKYNL